MKKLFIILLALTLLNLGACYKNCPAFDGSDNAFDTEAEKTKIKVVLEKLDTAIQTKNMGLFSQVFAHDPDIIIIGSAVLS